MSLETDPEAKIRNSSTRQHPPKGKRENRTRNRSAQKSLVKTGLKAVFRPLGDFFFARRETKTGIKQRDLLVKKLAFWVAEFLCSLCVVRKKMDVKLKQKSAACQYALMAVLCVYPN